MRRSVHLRPFIMFRSIKHGVSRFPALFCSAAWTTVLVIHVRVAKVEYSVFDVSCKPLIPMRKNPAADQQCKRKYEDHPTT